MSLRPGKCYREQKRPYTRVSEKKPKESYVASAPGIKIKQFEMGKEDGDYDVELRLIAEKDVQIRHNALESARTNANKHLNSEMEKYYMKVVTYPYQILRENAMATGAGADRLQEGMRRSFGAPTSRAARVDSGQTVMFVHVSSENAAAAKEALRRANSKLPTPCRIQVNRL